MSPSQNIPVTRVHHIVRKVFFFQCNVLLVILSHIQRETDTPASLAPVSASTKTALTPPVTVAGAGAWTIPRKWSARRGNDFDIQTLPSLSTSHPSAAVDGVQIMALVITVDLRARSSR
ncbi:hypothetical protein EVAR_24425_1 [Eumeta japonica]|uniref:Uncharacterized protein n=1 Tax=Eumeta variegata TaxID=151549 RepID=A0A4C1VQU7_EUMVA|nr:hypothetical protein EVAR_24425_1 [Eumeta japonica]